MDEPDVAGANRVKQTHSSRSSSMATERDGDSTPNPPPPIY